jgi:hypothetical protein
MAKFPGVYGHAPWEIFQENTMLRVRSLSMAGGGLKRNVLKPKIFLIPLPFYKKNFTPLFKTRRTT